MNPARGSQGRHNPTQPSIFAAESLSPAYPQRAAWGTSGSLRAWQAAALKTYMTDMPEDFLAVATPGAGKTTFALRVATELLAAGDVHQVTVVCPTEHLKYQWAEAAARVGIRLDPSYVNSQGVLGSHFDGVALTYAQVAANAALHRARTDATRTLVVLDEIHHGGDARSWGDAMREAFAPARRRLALTGTPFRSDESPIPFVRYVEEAGGVRRSRADYSYDYADALRDGVVRPVMFMTYSGRMRWRTRTGDEVAARLGEPLTKDLQTQAWRTALDPEGEWIPAVLAAADQRLSEVRRQMPDAGGLVIASDRGPFPARPPPSSCPMTPALPAASRPSRPAGTAGWWPCAWSPRASTCPASLSASTPPRLPRRCSSPRRSDASCVHAPGVRPPAFSCPR